MIDIDKYEGCIVDMKGYDLAMLAEELLAEVKRLREEISRLNKWEDNVREFFGDEVMMDLYDIYGGEEE
jgi:hypothetical protein|tara:strand:- start:852 stop:1058 length:207 start_codon:yes stop_codon:yes gene_type:complete